MYHPQPYRLVWMALCAFGFAFLWIGLPWQVWKPPGPCVEQTFHSLLACCTYEHTCKNCPAALGARTARSDDALLSINVDQLYLSMTCLQPFKLPALPHLSSHSLSRHVPGVSSSYAGATQCGCVFRRSRRAQNRGLLGLVLAGHVACDRERDPPPVRTLLLCFSASSINSVLLVLAGHVWLVIGRGIPAGICCCSAPLVFSPQPCIPVCTQCRVPVLSVNCPCQLFLTFYFLFLLPTSLMLPPGRRSCQSRSLMPRGCGRMPSWACCPHSPLSKAGLRPRPGAACLQAQPCGPSSPTTLRSTTLFTSS